MIYQAHDLVAQSVRTVFHAAAQALNISGGLANLFNVKSLSPLHRILSETMELSGKTFEHLSREHPEARLKIDHVEILGLKHKVEQELVSDKPFCSLMRFTCNPNKGNKNTKNRNVPKVLLVAPISGHRATLFQNTVRDLLPDAEVYITEWKDARDIPVSEGNFDLDTYFDYVQDFLRTIGPDTHMIGISQSTIPVLATTALMAAENDPCKPLSMTLMCGPIDPLVNETEISRLSRQRDIAWFRDNLIASVPAHYAGAGRKVFPGFIQAWGMMAAAPQKKHKSPLHVVDELFRGQGHKLDADAPYYLEMIERVFLEHRVARNTLYSRNRHADVSKIKDTGLMVIEGSADNIAAAGQTKVAHDLCTGIAPHLKDYHLAQGAGHYDVFQGPHWEDKISHRIKDFWRNIAAFKGITYDPPHAMNAANNSTFRTVKPALAV